VNAVLVANGADPAGNTVVGAGRSCADLHFTGLDHLAPGETVLLDVSPRGPHGYYGDATRTFVVGGDGGWARRAHVACEAAREAALAELGPGVPARDVAREAAAELRAHGFETDSDDRGFVHGLGHGVGVSLHEAPSLAGDATLRSGHVVTVEPGVYDPDVGGVRIEDLVVVTDDGHEVVGDLPLLLTPQSR
jgi:Xaa-Pro aminopeptidase